jgi:hypothetical protein
MIRIERFSAGDVPVHPTDTLREVVWIITTENIMKNTGCSMLRGFNGGFTSALQPDDDAVPFSQHLLCERLDVIDLACGQLQSAQIHLGLL